MVNFDFSRRQNYNKILYINQIIKKNKKSRRMAGFFPKYLMSKLYSITVTIFSSSFIVST